MPKTQPKPRRKDEDRKHVKLEVFRTPYDVFYTLYYWKSEFFEEAKVLDPSAGDARMLAELLQINFRNDHAIVELRDQDREAWRYNGVRQRLGRDRCLVGNFLELDLSHLGRFDVTLTNPPFTLTREFIEKCWSMTRTGGYIMMLQRLNWLGTIKRSRWFKEQMSLRHVWVITSRPTWELDDRENNTSDTYEYAWYVFQKGYHGYPEVDWLLPVLP